MVACERISMLKEALEGQVTLVCNTTAGKKNHNKVLTEIVYVCESE